MDLSCDTALKLIFSQMHLTHFWTIVYLEYTDLSTKALMFLMPFATTYLCETGFSALGVAVAEGVEWSSSNLKVKKICMPKCP